MSPVILSSAAKSFRVAALFAVLVGFVIGVMTWQQVRREYQTGLEDLHRKTGTLVHRLLPSARDVLRTPEPAMIAALGPRLEGHRRLIGFALHDRDGRLVAAGEAMGDYSDPLGGPVGHALARNAEIQVTSDTENGLLHMLAVPVRDADGSVLGSVVALHDASYLDERRMQGLVYGAFWILVISLFVVAAGTGLTWIAYERPLRRLTDWMKRLRTDNAAESPPRGLPNAALATESDRLAASLRAARSTMLTQSKDTVRADKIWTRERLRAHAVDVLQGDQLIVVSNREPYMHQLRDGRAQSIVPASGVVTALDPVLQACGGVWIAHGAGDADRESADPDGRLTVPPGDSRYTLRRLFLSREQEEGYYYGFSNEGLWPLCHLAHERPEFKPSDWRHYVEVNRAFADAVLDEVGGGRACVLAQDYHLALLPRLLTSARPDVHAGLFWHIPWPNPDAFAICPWKSEILQGMLGADVIGFHLQQHCNNFLDTVDRNLEARVDWDNFAIEFRGHSTLVRPFPISIQDWSERPVASGDELSGRISALRELHGLGDTKVAVGVDRIDYTKGIPERLRAVARFFEKYPQHRGKVTFVQLGAPSRTHIPRYRNLVMEVERIADEINWSFKTEHWKPICMLVAHHDSRAVHTFLRMAGICIVSSLHDGMNLVAKEYVSAQAGSDGALILSEFAGAARDLPEALIVNPYATDDFAEAIRQAVEMDPAERRRRMERMRATLEERNVYRWAADLVSAVARTERRPSTRSVTLQSAESKIAKP